MIPVLGPMWQQWTGGPEISGPVGVTDVALDGAGAVKGGRLVIDAAGTPKPLAVIYTKASWVSVVAHVENASYVYVGDYTIQNAAGTGGYLGHPLAPGQFINLREMAGASYIDLRYIYVDADVTADAVTFIAGIL